MTQEWTTAQEADNLRALFAKVPNKAEFARQFKVPGGASMLSQHLSGHRPISGEAAVAYAKGLGVPLSQISPRFAELVDSATDHLDGLPADGQFKPVRRADVSFSNGHGAVVYHEDERPPLVFRTDFLRKLGISNGNAVVVDAEGISNEPKIVDGSVVLVDRGDTTQLDGDFFAFRFEGELLIKRLQELKGIGILATAENPAFKPKTKVYTESEMDRFEIIGRAVWMGANL